MVARCCRERDESGKETGKTRMNQVKEMRIDIASLTSFPTVRATKRKENGEVVFFSTSTTLMRGWAYLMTSESQDKLHLWSTNYLQAIPAFFLLSTHEPKLRAGSLNQSTS